MPFLSPRRIPRAGLPLVWLALTVFLLHGLMHCRPEKKVSETSFHSSYPCEHCHHCSPPQPGDHQPGNPGQHHDSSEEGTCLLCVLLASGGLIVPVSFIANFSFFIVPILLYFHTIVLPPTQFCTNSVFLRGPPILSL